MIEIQAVTTRPLEQGDLALILDWRNHPEVRRYMYSQHPIKPEEHQQWFLNCQNNPERHPLIVEQEGKPFGFVNFTEHQNHKVADWGFYLAPDSQRGMGSLLGQSALDYAFNTLKLHKICGEALGFNDKSIRFHLKMGFQQEGLLKDQFFDAQQSQFHDIACFGLLASEWSLQYSTPEHPI